MPFIVDVNVRKVLDSRGNPTVEVDIWTDEVVGTAASPSGASVGKNEVAAFPKKGVEEGIKAFRKLVAPKLVGLNVLDHRSIDEIMKEADGTKDLSKVGGNLIIAASMACARAASEELNIPLFVYLGGNFTPSIPYPMGNVIGGGKHAVGGTTIQEFLACVQSHDASVSVFANAGVHKNVKEELKKRLPGSALGKGDEGAWVAPLDDREALDVLSRACKKASRQYKVPIKPSLDIAASSFYKNGKYVYSKRELSKKKQIEFVSELVRMYSLASVEDPLEEEDFEGFAEVTDIVGKECLVIGDDIFVTNIERLKKGISMCAGNAILIKPNQIGTVTDMIDTITYAKQHGYDIVVSHRSGETEDTFISHLATAFSAYAIKCGAVGGERTAKLNELVRIQEMM